MTATFVELDDNINFHKYFPKLIESMSNYKIILGVKRFGDGRINVGDIIDKQRNELMPIFKDEIESVLPNNYW